MEDGRIEDSDLTASSSQRGMGPAQARIRSGEAWCPRGRVAADQYTYLEVNLRKVKVVTRVETQGRRTGQEFTDAFIVEFQRYEHETSWRRFYQKNGKEIFTANSDQYYSVYQNLDPPLIARRMRIVPFVRQKRRICLTMELYGCEWQEAILSYQVPQAHTYAPRSERPLVLDDSSYDGNLDDRTLIYKNGLGKLTDFEIGNAIWRRRETPWVGWNKRKLKRELTILFQFDGARNVSNIRFMCLVSRDEYIDTFSSVKLQFSLDGKNFGHEKEIFSLPGIRMDNIAVPMEVPVRHTGCRYVRVTLDFRNDWIFISEVSIESTPTAVAAQQTVQLDPGQNSVRSENSRTQGDRQNNVQYGEHSKTSSAGPRITACTRGSGSGLLSSFLLYLVGYSWIRRVPL